MNVLSQIAAAIRAAFAGVRTVARRCTRTGKMIFETVRDAAASVGYVPAPAQAAAAKRVVPKAAEAVGETRWDAVRALAAAMVGQRETQDDYVGISERDASWLSAVSTQGLVRIACATDQQLEDHVSGREVIKGVCAADPESVAAKLIAMAREEMPEVPAMTARTDELIEASTYGLRMAAA